MNRKIISVFLLLILILTGIQESFAYPQYGSSCSKCHTTNPDQNPAQNPAQNGLGRDMGNNNVSAQGRWSIISPTDGNKNKIGDIPSQKMNPMRYTLGIIGTVLVAISQFYSLRKRGDVTIINVILGKNK